MWGVCGAIPAPHGPTLGKDPAQGMLCLGPDPWWGQRLPGAGGISKVTLQGAHAGSPQGEVDVHVSGTLWGMAGGTLLSAGAHGSGQDGSHTAGHAVGNISEAQARAYPRSASHAQRTGSDGHHRIRSWKVFPLLSASLNPID